MRVGYVIHRFPWPSETFISREVAALVDRGEDLRIYSFVRPGNDDVRLLSPQAKALMERTVYVDNRASARSLLSVRGARMTFLAQVLMRNVTATRRRTILAARAAELASRAKADGISQLHAHWPYSTVVCHLAAHELRIPYSVSVHAHEALYDNAHFAGCFKSLTFATFCNAATMNVLLKTLPHAARSKSHLVYHGVDIASFPPSPAPPIGPPVRVLSAGRLTKTKGFDRLIRACAHARQQGIDVELTILGRGPALEELTNLAETLRFADHLSLPGWVGHDEMPNYYGTHHVFALLANTDFNDGLPNVVLEAMAMGRPVIVSPLPAAAEAIDHGRTGFVLNGVEDFDGFTQALKSLSSTQDSARGIGEAARRTVLDRYDARHHIAILEDLLRTHSKR